jgi:hypothetical protein
MSENTIPPVDASAPCSDSEQRERHLIVYGPPIHAVIALTSEGPMSDEEVAEVGEMVIRDMDGCLKILSDPNDKVEARGK